MNSNIAYWTIAFIGLFCAHGCGSSDTNLRPKDIDDRSILTVRMLAENIDAYSGYQVRVRGYLITNGPELNLTIDESGAITPNEPYIVISDTSLTTESSDGVTTAASTMESLGCTDHFVELTGMVGKTIRGVTGVVYIISVNFIDGDRPFPNNSCYLAEG